MKSWLALVAIGLLLLVARARALEPSADPQPLRFKIVNAATEASASPGTRTLLAIYGWGDQATKFLIVLDGKRVRAVGKNGEPAPVEISFSKGRFRHVVGSKPGPFLHALAAALEAKAPKLSQTKADVLPFGMAILGAHESRDRAGGFSSEPGDWVVTKLFLADGDAEIYFNFNPVSGDAEFSMKDEAYGNRIIEELSKVVW